jgi:hypothetical protein
MGKQGAPRSDRLNPAQKLVQPMSQFEAGLAKNGTVVALWRDKGATKTNLRRFNQM